MPFGCGQAQRHPQTRARTLGSGLCSPVSSRLLPSTLAPAGPVRRHQGHYDFLRNSDALYTAVAAATELPGRCRCLRGGEAERARVPCHLDGSTSGLSEKEWTEVRALFRGPQEHSAKRPGHSCLVDQEKSGACGSGSWIDTSPHVGCCRAPRGALG